MYNRPIYYLQCTWYIGRPSTTYLVYWSIGHPVLAHMSDNRLVQETYNWGVGTLTVIFRGKNRYFKKKCNRGRRLLEFLICWRNIYVLLANTKKTFALKQQQNTLNGNKNFIGKCKDRGWRCQIIFIYGSTLRSLWPWPCTRDSISAPEIIIGSEFRFYFGSHTSLILRV